MPDGEDQIKLKVQQSRIEIQPTEWSELNESSLAEELLEHLQYKNDFSTFNPN